MLQVCSLDGNSLFTINQRLQAARDCASYPKTPPQQMPPSKPVVVSPPVLLCADASHERLPGIRITRILAPSAQQQLRLEGSSQHDTQHLQHGGQVGAPPQDSMLDTGGSWDDEEGLVNVRFPYHDAWA